MLLNSYIIQWTIKATTIFCISNLLTHTLGRQHVSCAGRRAHHTTGTYHNSAVLRAAGNDLVVVWAPVYVQHWSCVATYCWVGFVNSTSLKGERNIPIRYHQGHRVCMFSQIHFSFITSTLNSQHSTNDNVHSDQPTSTNKNCQLTFLEIVTTAAATKSLQSCPTLCNPIDDSPPGSAVPGILQARTLEWVAISFSNAWKWKAKVKSLSRFRLLATPLTAAYQAPLSMGFSRLELGCHCLLWVTTGDTLSNKGAIFPEPEI